MGKHTSTIIAMIVKFNVINEYFEQFIDELTEYDSVVNQFFCL